MANPASQWVARQLVRYRYVTAVAALAVLGTFAPYIAGLEFDSSLDVWFLQDDPEIVTYRDFNERFGSDELLLIAMPLGDPFTVESLALTARLTEALESLANVHRVRSLTNVDIVLDEGGVAAIGPLIEDLPTTAEEAEAIREKALGAESLRGMLLSPAGDSEAMVVELVHIPGEEEYKFELLHQVRGLLAANGVPDALVAGTPAVDDAFFRYTENDFRRFTLPLLAVILLATFLLLRRPWALVAILAVVVTSIVFVFGLMAATGVKINIASTVLGPLIAAVGIADSMHVVDHYLELIARGQTPRAALEETLAHTLWPCLLTSTTTAAGLGSLGISSLAPVRELGFFAAAGVIGAFLLTFTVLPLLMSWVRHPLGKKSRSRALARESGPIGGILVAIAEMRRPTAFAILGVSVLCCVAAAIGMAHIHVGTNSMDYFKTDDPLRIEMTEVDRRIGGSVSLEFIIEGPAGLAKRPEVIKAIEGLERYLETLDGVTGTFSIVGPIKEMNRVMFGEPEAYEVPDSASLLAKYLVLMEGTDDFSAAVSTDYDVLRMTTRVRMESSEALARSMPAVEQYLATHFTGDHRATPTGLVKLMAKTEIYLLQTQVRSFSLAFVIIFLLMVLLLGSFRVGLLAMIPNFLPVFLIVGSMGLFGVPLDVSTVMIASIAIGLVVDDTIHLLTRLRRELEAEAGAGDTVPGEELTRLALRRTLVGTGRAVLATSVVLTAGFLVLLIASFRPNILFGILSAATVVAALLADVLVLPAVVIAFRLRLLRSPKQEPKLVESSVER